MTVKLRSGPARQTALAAAGDLAAFLLFALAGRRSHDEASSLLAALGTAAPFLVTWAVVAPLAGAYRADVLARPRATAVHTAHAWAVAGPLALVLRALFLSRGIPASFAAVALGVNLLLLLAWRLIFARLLAKSVS